MLHFCCYVNWLPVCRVLMLPGCCVAVLLCCILLCCILLCCLFAAMLTGCLLSRPYVNWLPLLLRCSFPLLHVCSVAFCCDVNWLPVVGPLCLLVVCGAFLLCCRFAVLHFCCYGNWLPVVGPLCKPVVCVGFGVWQFCCVAFLLLC